jgi:hypothetical protein
LFQFQNAVRAQDTPTLILDFTGVPYTDSAAIGALVGVSDRIHSRTTGNERRTVLPRLQFAVGRRAGLIGRDGS